MAKLFDLLTEEEKDTLKKIKWLCPNAYSETEVKNLTWEQLFNISFMLIKTEYGKKELKIMQLNCILSSESIKILTDRAIKKNIAIF